MILAVPDISRQNFKNVVDITKSYCTRLYSMIVDDEEEWKAKHGCYPDVVYPGLTSKALASMYNAKYLDSKDIDSEYVSKRVNDLARAGRLLVVSTVKCPVTAQDVYSWRVSTAAEIDALTRIGALEKNRSSVDWENAIWLQSFILPFKGNKVPNANTFQSRSLRTHFKAVCKQQDILASTVESWVNESMFKGIRLLGMPTVMRCLRKGESGKKLFFRLSVEAIISEGKPKRSGIGANTLSQCDEYRESRVKPVKPVVRSLTLVL